jgi:hypothetical protein
MSMQATCCAEEKAWVSAAGVWAVRGVRRRPKVAPIARARMEPSKSKAPAAPLDDVTEVSNYVAAMRH